MFHFAGFRNLGTVIAAAIFSAVSAQAAPGPVYEAVIDAGSSGTRLYLYKIVRGAYPLVTMEMDKTDNKTQPNGYEEDGVSNFVCGNQRGYSPPAAVVPQVISPLLSPLAARLVELGVPRNQVVVNVLATAGMRVAAAQCGQAAANALYNFIKRGIAAHGFLVGDARTTDGDSEEGVWTWTNLNDRVYNVFRSARAPVGVIEVGGSSTQISYPTRQQPNPARNIYRVSINGRAFSVFNRTYLGLGQDDARKFIRLQAAPQVCWANGFPFARDVGEAEPIYPRLKTNGAYGAAFDMLGCGDMFAGYIAGIIARNGDPKVADSAGNFVGVDGAYWATEYWNIQNAPSQLAGNLDHCKNYRYFPHILTARDAQFQCPNAIYINSLLFGAAGGLFRSNPGKVVETLPNADPVTGASILTWTRGYLLIKYSRLVASGAL